MSHSLKIRKNISLHLFLLSYKRKLDIILKTTGRVIFSSIISNNFVHYSLSEGGNHYWPSYYGEYYNTNIRAQTNTFRIQVCIYTDTSYKQREPRWLQPVQSLNVGKRGPWLDIWLQMALLWSSIHYVLRATSWEAKGQAHCDAGCFSLLNHVSDARDPGIPYSNGAKPISKACSSPLQVYLLKFRPHFLLGHP